MTGDKQQEGKKVSEGKKVRNGARKRQRLVKQRTSGGGLAETRETVVMRAAVRNKCASTSASIGQESAVSFFVTRTVSARLFSERDPFVVLTRPQRLKAAATPPEIDADRPDSGQIQARYRPDKVDVVLASQQGAEHCCYAAGTLSGKPTQIARGLVAKPRSLRVERVKCHLRRR
eukprot:5236401-Pleurochrysis_carterae.AAC.1